MTKLPTVFDSEPMPCEVFRKARSAFPHASEKAIRNAWGDAAPVLQRNAFPHGGGDDLDTHIHWLAARQLYVHAMLSSSETTRKKLMQSASVLLNY
ncbi:hypothetical protein [Xanthomonas floridensis]|uniref:Uncharacterized protein n=1 Tax=Xanthomonas floridensis TaxID=1843580 RepID=A0A1A9MDX9_9XANT|nr:hypothetical protein [Xanthomonas floridensis]MEA5124344.1 hypothetical protein [Xanthomonas floridensis]MEA5132037.1 hypothetical protein [Xanthomonas floridensis]OAG68342.1 hypothetical protein A7D17_14895 [Xanthomonas floridensis]